MKLSLQNVSIIFGVTLIHLFVIAAVSPVEGEWTETLSEIEIDPALESFFDEVVTELKGDEKADPTGAEASEKPVAPPRNDAPPEGITPGEMADLRVPPADGEHRIDEPPPLPPTVKDLAETDIDRKTQVTSNDTAALEPPRQIRQIRSLQPIPRS